MNKEIENIFITKHIKLNNKNNNPTKIHSAIGRKEFEFLYNLTLNNKLVKCIEVGMAFGISALAICKALEKIGKGKLLSIDPFQTTQWNSNGLKLLKKMDLSKYHKLIENKSFNALPLLLNKNTNENKNINKNINMNKNINKNMNTNKNKYDLVFIDGWHTFDYTLVDAFYADQLTKIGGYIVIDDVLHFSVKQCIKYLDTNYKHWERIPSPETFACYKKISNDKRAWNFHVKI